MKPSEQRSTASSIFDETFRENPDPWGYTTNYNEISKFRATIQSFAKSPIQKCF
jgi:hypothetical protein